MKICEKRIRNFGIEMAFNGNTVNISVEATIENQIQEITYDGQETYQS